MTQTMPIASPSDPFEHCLLIPFIRINDPNSSHHLILYLKGIIGRFLKEYLAVLVVGRVLLGQAKHSIGIIGFYIFSTNLSG